jgi:short-subunit dehydrogenase
MLINNAGFATYGPFETKDLAREQEEVMVNVYSVVTLTHLYLPKLLEAPGASIVNVASTAAFQPLPFMAVYGASKAFVLSFSEALWAQLKDTHVTVLAFCPGPVKTQFEHVVNAPEAMVGKKDTPEFVVEKALRALEARRSFVIPRFSQHFVANLSRFIPRSTVAVATAKVLKPRTATSQPSAQRA